MRSLLLACALALALAPSLDAQRLGREPRRPRLPSGADTNDASAYLQAGHQAIEESPVGAADAYYWAARIDPGSADALYGLRMAVLMRRAAPFRQYMQGNRRTIFSREMRANDSLQFRAFKLDPFLHLRHGRVAQMRYYRLDLQGAGVNTALNSRDVDIAIDDLLHRASHGTKARLAAAEGKYNEAIMLYGQAIAVSREPAYYYLDRAAVHALNNAPDLAIMDYTKGLEELRKEDDDEEEEVVFYSSKALYEHSIGLLLIRKGELDGARTALGRAMEEDLSFYPAHLALALVALATADTATALSEVALAAELAPDEPLVHYRHGELLHQAGQHAEAIAPLRKAIALEPYYADPQYVLGLALDVTGDKAGARAAYQRFLAISTRRDPRRTTVTTALAALGGGD